MPKFRLIVPLTLIVSLISLTSACDKSSINENMGSNINVSSAKSGETNNSNADKNTAKITANPWITPDNKGIVTPLVNDSVVSKDIIIKEKVMGSDKKQLNEDDFEVSYKNISINKNTKIEDITKKLGFPEDYEANNKGYISGNAKYRRWNLCYPNYSKPEIRIIVLSEKKYVGEEVKDGNNYIVGIYLEAFSTKRILKVEDELETALRIYGRPDSFEKDKENAEGLYYLRYSKGDINLDITLDKDMRKVEYIFIDYNMKKSADDQQGVSN